MAVRETHQAGSFRESLELPNKLQVCAFLNTQCLAGISIKFRFFPECGYRHYGLTNLACSFPTFPISTLFLPVNYRVDVKIFAFFFCAKFLRISRNFLQNSKLIISRYFREFSKNAASLVYTAILQHSTSRSLHLVVS